MTWKKFETTGEVGSENGVILIDEEYDDACRITLEKCSEYYAVTCGIYGAMVHTAFFSENEHHAKYEAMKQDLQEFVDHAAAMSEDEQIDFYADFCNKY